MLPLLRLFSRRSWSLSWPLPWHWSIAAHTILSVGAYIMAIQLLAQYPLTGNKIKHQVEDALPSDGPTFSRRMVAWEYAMGASVPSTATPQQQANSPGNHCSRPTLLAFSLGLSVIELLSCAIAAMTMALASKLTIRRARLHQQTSPVTPCFSTASVCRSLLLAPITALSSAATAIVLSSLVQLSSRPLSALGQPTGILSSFVAIRIAILTGGLLLASTSATLSSTSSPSKYSSAHVLAAFCGLFVLSHVGQLNSIDNVLHWVPMLAIASTLASMPQLWVGCSHFHRGIHYLVAAMALFNSMLTLSQTEADVLSIMRDFTSSPPFARFALLIILAQVTSQYGSLQTSNTRHDGHWLASSRHVVRDVAAVLLASLVPGTSPSFKFGFGTTNAWTAMALTVAAASMVHKTAQSQTVHPFSCTGGKDRANGSDKTKLPLTRQSSTTEGSYVTGRPLNIWLLMLSTLLFGFGLSEVDFAAISRATAVPTIASPSPLTKRHHVTQAHHVGFSNHSRVDTTITLIPDSALPAPAPGRKAAQVFAVDATFGPFTAFSSLSTIASTFQARLPSLDKWPRRKWDSTLRQAKGADTATESGAAPPSNASSSSATPLQLKQLWFAAGGNPNSFARNLLASATFGNESGMQYRVYWTREDDPIGMHGQGGFLVDAFRKVTRDAQGISGLVVMEGEPKRPDRTMHRKWFKMLSHMYETAPPHVHWFMIGDDDTIWFPHVLHPLLATLPLDPTKHSAYLGDRSESNRQSNIFGHTMGFGGGGAAISRALAARIYAKLDWCLHELDDFYGDGLMRTCIERVTSMDGKGEPVQLTRIPVFNQVDLLEWGFKGREFFSARFSRAAPVTLHHTDHAPPLISGVLHRGVGTFKLWHLTRQMPVELMFRRFMVHLPKMPSLTPSVDGKTSEVMQTVVITYGFHVRVYHGLPGPLDADHHVDFDSEIPTSPDFVGIEWLLEDSVVAGQEPDKWPKPILQYADYFLAEVDEIKSRMIYVDERSGKRLAIQVQCPSAARPPSGQDDGQLAEAEEGRTSSKGMYSMCS